MGFRRNSTLDATIRRAAQLIDVFTIDNKALWVVIKLKMVTECNKGH